MIGRTGQVSVSVKLTGEKGSWGIGWGKAMGVLEVVQKKLCLLAGVGRWCPPLSLLLHLPLPSPQAGAEGRAGAAVPDSESGAPAALAAGGGC